MKKMILTTVLLFVAFSCKKKENSNTKNTVTTVSKQTIDIASIENKIMNLVKQAENSEDSYDMYKKAFNLLKETAIKYPKETFNYSFKKLEKNDIIHIFNSSDSKLRYYTWDEHTGGTWKNFDGMYQINNNGSISSNKLPENNTQHSNPFVKNLHTIKGTEQNYYIINTVNVFSTKDISETAKSYYIENKNLTPIELFKTNKKGYSEIKISYNTTQSNKGKMIIIDNESVKFRVINKKQTGTKKFLNYIWKGNYYQYDGIVDTSSDQFIGLLGQKLVNNESFGDIEIGLSTDKIINLLGEPNKSLKGEYSDMTGEYQGNLNYSNQGIFLGTSGKEKEQQKIDFISIKAPCKLKTNKNIGIGSTATECIEAYLPHLDPYTFKGSELNLNDGITGMKIWFENNKVSAISLGNFGE